MINGLILFTMSKRKLTRKSFFFSFWTGQNLVPEPEIQVQETLQERRGSAGSQPERQRLHGLQLSSIPGCLGQ